MSVLMQFSIFPVNKSDGVSQWVSRVVAMVRDSGYPYKLNSMATVVETPSMPEALQILNQAYDLLKPDCDRVYCTAAFDMRSDGRSLIDSKIKAVESKIGSVDH